MLEKAGKIVEAVGEGLRWAGIIGERPAATKVATAGAEVAQKVANAALTERQVRLSLMGVLETETDLSSLGFRMLSHSTVFDKQQGIAGTAGVKGMHKVIDWRTLAGKNDPIEFQYRPKSGEPVQFQAQSITIGPEIGPNPYGLRREINGELAPSHMNLIAKELESQGVTLNPQTARATFYNSGLRIAPREPGAELDVSINGQAKRVSALTVQSRPEDYLQGKGYLSFQMGRSQFDQTLGELNNLGVRFPDNTDFHATFTRDGSWMLQPNEFRTGISVGETTYPYFHHVRMSGGRIEFQPEPSKQYQVIFPRVGPDST